jgi:antitoxin FitA
MGTLTIRNVEDDLKRDLRIRAAELGKSMEEEARSIIRVVVREGLSLSDLEGRKIRQGGSAWDIVARLR